MHMRMYRPFRYAILKLPGKPRILNLRELFFFSPYAPIVGALLSHPKSDGTNGAEFCIDGLTFIENGVSTCHSRQNVCPPFT